MIIIVGYACINTSLGDKGRFRTTTVKSASKLSPNDRYQKLKRLTLENLNTVYRILQWNVHHDIFMYRVSSNILPLQGHELNNFDWTNDPDVIDICNTIKQYVVDNNLRLSVHPSQFCVLSSHNPKVVESSIEILRYHDQMCDLMGITNIVVHVGSTNGGKQEAMSRFIDTFIKLDKSIQDRLILENDDKSYNLDHVLDMCELLNIPCCLDVHHERCYPAEYELFCYIDRIINTWSHRSERPKCHLSSGYKNLTDRKHADYIDYDDYLYCKLVTRNQFDIMFECKAKELGILSIRSNLLEVG